MKNIPYTLYGHGIQFLLLIPLLLCFSSLSLISVDQIHETCSPLKLLNFLVGLL